MLSSYNTHFTDYVPGKLFSKLKGVPGEGWGFIEASPLPPKDEVVAVAHAIMYRTRYEIWEGKLYSLARWGTKFQYLPKPIVEALRNIQDTKFLVALHTGTPGVLDGQPIAIALEPQITHAMYPDHPHLNFAHMANINGKNFFLPTSLCYTDNPAGLGHNKSERVNNAAEIVCEWLFRHQIWLSTRQNELTGTWIGPEAPPPEIYSYWLYNPQGRCRCGKPQNYQDCHMISDVSMTWRETQEWATNFVQQYCKQRCWEFGNVLKEEDSIRVLKKAMAI